LLGWVLAQPEVQELSAIQSKVLRCGSHLLRPYWRKVLHSGSHLLSLWGPSLESCLPRFDCVLYVSSDEDVDYKRGSLTNQSRRNSNEVEGKLLYKAVKRETPTVEYYKAAETEKRLDHNPGQAKHDSHKTSGQHNAETNPRHTPAETKKLTEHRSDRVRPESHDTSTDIPDLHEVGKEQPGVTPRDTKQPSENKRLTIGTTISDLHKVEGPQAEPPCTSGTPRGQGTTHSGATTDNTKERVSETVVGCLHKVPRKNPQNGNH
ncbi:hypothetical protein Taro_045328, partial [Colocasia esculenta]|nr:hypothetical protein [Colocasia esculenta]